MEKLFVYFKADDQQLVCCNPFRVSSKKIAYVEAHFDLGENWTGYDSVRAIWRNTQNFAIIGTVLDSQGICKVPTEVLTSIGQVDVNLVGSISENNVLTDRLTTYPVEAGRVDANALVDGSETAEITPSQFEQFAAAVRNDAERAREGAEAAESYADAAAGSADDAAGSAQSAADDAARIAQMIQEVIDQIEDFYGVTVSVETLPAGSQATARYEEGHLYLGIPKGDKGDTGNGIDAITKTGTSGLVDTYTITFTNGQTTTFAVTNGEKGDTGNGIASITKTGTSGLVDTYTITYTDGQTETFTVTNGEKGDTGNGIDRIELTSTSGYVKTYTIYFTDGSTTTFEVMDGEVSLEDYYKQFIEDTASGSIASFPDGADDIPMISVLADIEPVQDLNGYDKPWSGGNGKNKFDKDAQDTSKGFVQGRYLLNNGNEQNPSTPSEWNISEYISVKPNTQYILSGLPTSGANVPSLCQYDADKNFLTGLNYLNSANRGITTQETTAYVRLSIPTANANVMQLEEGSATSYEPYSNICPISGHTDADVTRTGKNLLDKTSGTFLANNAIFGGTAQDVDGSLVLDVGTYTFSVSEVQNGLYVDDASGRIASKYTTQSISFTITEKKAVKLTTYKAVGDISIIESYNYQLELGSTATSYEPYQGETKTVQFIDEQGNQLTVYGGQDEIIGGILTMTHGLYVIDGVNTRITYGAEYCNIVPYGQIDPMSPRVSQWKSNIFEPTPSNIGFNTTYKIVYFMRAFAETIASTQEEFNAYCQAHPIQLWYPLAEPQTYQLTPQHINTMLGANNVWADTGDVEVKYRADTKLYIDKVLAS